MLWALRLVVFAAMLSPTVITYGQDAFPPIGDRYKNPSDELRQVVKALQKLQAQTEIGVDLVDYTKALSDTLPDVKVFLGSQEAKLMPELRYLLSNAVDCHLKVRDIWSQSVSSTSSDSALMITARPALWKTATANVSGAAALLESSPQDLVKTQEKLADSLSLLTADAAIASAKTERANLDRQSRAKTSGVAVPQKDPVRKNFDLAAILHAHGDFGDTVTAGPIEEQLWAGFCPKLPPALQEGQVELFRDVESCGAISGFIYADETAAQIGLDALSSGFGDSRQQLKGLGNSASGVDDSSSRVSMVFRRGPVLVYLMSPLKPMAQTVAAAKKLDDRIVKLFPESASSATDSEPFLPDLLYQDGDFDDSIKGGDVTMQLPPWMSRLPLALQKGHLPLLKDDKELGSVVGLIYPDMKVARQAFDEIASQFGDGKKRVKGLGAIAFDSKNEGLGPLALPSESEQSKSVYSLVFRRGPVVIYAVTGEQSVAAAALNIDKRIAALFPEAESHDEENEEENEEMAMEEGQTKTLSESDSSDNPLAGLLFQDGDYGKAIRGGEFKTTTDEFVRLSMNVSAKGCVRLSGDGGVVGFVLENKSDAKKAYEAIAEQIGRDGKIAVGLGETSWASRTPVNERMDVVFRRDVFVIYVRVKSKSLAEVTKRVKSVDSRIRKHLAAGDAE